MFKSIEYKRNTRKGKEENMDKYILYNVTFTSDVKQINDCLVSYYQPIFLLQHFESDSEITVIQRGLVLHSPTHG